jgi:ribosomal protein S12 methylthiotransferase
MPGETEEDFESLVNFVKEHRFERMGTFQYSDEEGTAAFDFDGKVPKRTIERRWRELMAVQQRISREQNKAMIGKRLKVLVEGVSPESDDLLVGRHEGQAPEIDGQVYLNDGLGYPGEMVIAEVTEAHEYDLVAKIVERPDPKRAPHSARSHVPANVRGGEQVMPAPAWLAPR